MSETRTRDLRTDPADEAVAASAQGSVSASAAKTARRTLIGPFTARQVGMVNAIVAGAGLLLVVVVGRVGQEAGSTIDASGFYRLAAETQGLQVGQPAPDFVGPNGEEIVRLTDLDGREMRLADFAGKPIWVVFLVDVVPAVPAGDAQHPRGLRGEPRGGPGRPRGRRSGAGRHDPPVCRAVRPDLPDRRRHVRGDHADVPRVRVAEPLLHRP